MTTRCLIGVFVFIDATAASVVPAFKDKKIMVEVRSQIPDKDTIKDANLFINKIEDVLDYS
jgi:hypothetical protein